MKKPFTKLDAAITAGFFLTALATRIPFRSLYLYDWDSVGFALALERFSLAEQQPHPPGYILYIGIGRFLNLFFNDANTALVAISIIGSAASVAGMFLLGRSIFGSRTGIVAAALMLFSPLNWFYGEIAFTYALGLALATLATWFLYELIFERRHAIGAAITLGLAAGVRTDIFLFLVIFFLIGSFRVDRRTMLLSWAALAVSALAWFAPLVYISGGISAYREIISAQSDVGVLQLSPFGAGPRILIDNAASIGAALTFLLGSAIFSLFYAVLRIAFKGWLLEDRRILFLLLLTVPALIFFILFIIPIPGYLLIFSAPLVLVAARSLLLISKAASGEGRERYGKAAARAGPIILVALVTIISVVNICLFLFPKTTLAWVPLKGQAIGERFALNGEYVISKEDEKMSDLTSQARIFEAGKTAVISYRIGEWRKIGYYLPEYAVFVPRSVEFSYYFEMFDHVWTKHTGNLTIEVPASTENLLFMNPASEEVPQPAALLSPQLIPVYVFELPETDAVSFKGFSIQRQNS